MVGSYVGGTRTLKSVPFAVISFSAPAGSPALDPGSQETPTAPPAPPAPPDAAPPPEAPAPPEPALAELGPVDVVDVSSLPHPASATSASWPPHLHAVGTRS